MTARALKGQQTTFADPAFTGNRAAPVHRWVPWIAGFSKQFIADALKTYANGHSKAVLDPFAGVGTTLIESDLAGHSAVGFEINPYAAFAAQQKLSAHRVSADRIRRVANDLRTHAQTVEASDATPEASPPSGFRTRAPFYSPKVERKVLLMLDFVQELRDPLVADLVRLAFASTMVDYSNYSYEPSLGRRASAGRADVKDYPVAGYIGKKLSQMADDVDWYRQHRNRSDRPDGTVHVRSFFDSYKLVTQASVDLLVTSPPYVNNYHYNRNTRPHMYWLGFCESPDDTRLLEEQNFGTYWQRAREQQQVELEPAAQDDEICWTVSRIRSQNSDRGIYGGQGWANYVATYCNDCVRFLDGVKWCLRSGATALVVIGNSIVQGIPVPTEKFVSKIANRQGLDAVAIHTPRETRVGSSIVNSSVRAGTASKGSSRLYESVVELRQP